MRGSKNFSDALAWDLHSVKGFRTGGVFRRDVSLRDARTETRRKNRNATHEPKRKRPMATDPICGMTVDEASAESWETDGETYYFCCRHCREKFIRQRGEGDSGCCHEGDQAADSGHRDGSHGDADGGRGRAAAGGYFCPMCEGVEQDHPGVCPKCGMDLEPRAGGRSEDEGEAGRMTVRFWAAAALTLPVFLLAMLPMFGVPVGRWVPETVNRWLQALLTTPVLAWAGATFFVRGWRSIVSRSPNRTCSSPSFTTVWGSPSPPACSIPGSASCSAP